MLITALVCGRAEARAAYEQTRPLTPANWRTGFSSQLISQKRWQKVQSVAEWAAEQDPAIELPPPLCTQIRCDEESDETEELELPAFTGKVVTVDGQSELHINAAGELLNSAYAGGHMRIQQGYRVGMLLLYCHASRSKLLFSA